MMKKQPDITEIFTEEELCIMFLNQTYVGLG